MALRYLYAYKFDCKKSFDTIKEYLKWREEEVPKIIMNKDLTEAIVLISIYSSKVNSLECLEAINFLVLPIL